MPKNRHGRGAGGELGKLWRRFPELSAVSRGPATCASRLRQVVQAQQPSGPGDLSTLLISQEPEISHCGARPTSYAGRAVMKSSLLSTVTAP